MTDTREMGAKEIREQMDDLVLLIDRFQNELKELKRELKRRGLELNYTKRFAQSQ